MNLRETIDNMTSNSDSMIPISRLGAMMLLVACALLLSTFLIQSEYVRYYALGAGTACFVVAALQFVVTKAVIWPANIALKKEH